MRDNIMYTLRDKTDGCYLWNSKKLKDAKLYKTPTYLNKLLQYSGYSNYELVQIELKIV